MAKISSRGEGCCLNSFPWARSQPILCTTLYSLVQWNWFSAVTGCTWVTCISDVREPISLHQAVQEAQWPIGYGVGLRIKRSSVRIRPWPLRWVLGQGSLLPLSQGEAFTLLASISYLPILVKYILAKKKETNARAHFGGRFDQLSFWRFYKRFASTFCIPRKKVKMAIESNQGGGGEGWWYPNQKIVTLKFWKSHQLCIGKFVLFS